MVHRMTTWTLNAVLATMAATAVFLPAPDEIRKAIQYNRQPVQLELESLGPEVIGTTARDDLSAASVEVRFPPAVDCLKSDGTLTPNDIERCVPGMVDKVKSFDRKALARMNFGQTVYPNPTIEETRLAVINLCRANWSANRITGPHPNTDDCRSMTVGVAY